MVAPGTTAPEASYTVPAMPPVGAWAKAGTAMSRIKENRQRRGCILYSFQGDSETLLQEKVGWQGQKLEGSADMFHMANLRRRTRRVGIGPRSPGKDCPLASAAAL